MTESIKNEIQPFKFTWRIENFLLSNECFISPTFLIEASHKTRWSLELHSKSNIEGCISIYLKRLEDSGPRKVIINYEFAIITASGLALPQKVENWILDSIHRTDHTSWKRDELLSEKNIYFPDNSFTIQCQIWSSMTIQPLMNSIMAQTFVGTDKLSFKICVQNFSSCFSGNLSPIKVPVQMSNKLEITFKTNNRFDEYISIDIRICDRTSNYFFLLCKLSLLDIKGVPQESKESEHMFEYIDDIWSFPPFIEIQKLKRNEKSIFNDDILFLNCEITTSTGKALLSRIVAEKSIDSSVDKIAILDTLSTNLECLYSGKKFSDIELRVGNVAFQAHRAILSCRSPVFEAMFQNDMAEKKTGIIDIMDINPETLEELLKFLYSGKVKELNIDMAMQLLSAADKYQVLQLKEKCSAFLNKNITSENVCEILHLADAHGDEFLKSAILQYFYAHSSEILASDGWNNLIDNSITLASEMLRQLSKHQK